MQDSGHAVATAGPQRQRDRPRSLTKATAANKRPNRDVVRWLGRCLAIGTARNLISCPVLNWNRRGLAQFRVLMSKLVFTQTRVDGRQEVIHLEVQYEAGWVLKT